MSEIAQEIPDRCPQCAEPSVRLVMNVRSYPVARCFECGVFFLAPMPTEEELKRVYDADWQTSDGALSRSYYDPESEALNRKRNFEPRLKWLAQHGFSGRILDVGASVGTFLNAATEAGWIAEGIELGEEACRRAREATGCRVEEGTIETANLAEGSYDAIHASQVIEHVLEPWAFLERARQLLRPGGALLVATPIIDNHVYRLTGPPQHALIPALSRGRMHAFPWAIHPPYHTYIQSRNSLRQLLARAGFRVVEERVFPWNNFYKMNLKWTVYYRVMNGVFRLLRSGQNIDVLAVSASD